jgi:RHS repeat-associated protein
LNQLSDTVPRRRVITLTCDRLAQGLPYDPASQVTNILHQLTASSSQINKADYLYNGVGNRTSLTDKRGAQTFGYDNLDQLTSASHPMLATPQSFAYDPVGNRTTGGTVVNAGNQLTADTNHTYQYDDNGNLVRKTLLATGSYTQYTYDAENRLTQVEDFVAGNPTPAFTSTYRYDGLGRRIEKVANGQTRRYVYDFEDILLEYDGANTLLARYTHGPRIDEPIAVTRGSSTYFYHADALGSVSELTDSGGAVAKSYIYDSFGSVLDQSGTVENSYTYAGRELDSESGLYYFRTRYYDPRIGRFLRKDPVGLIAGVNLYAFVGNNPVNRFDPWGLFPLTDCVKGILAPYFPGLNLDLIDIHEGLPWYTRDNVLAITRGNDIYFGPGKYDPHSRAGIGLIGHETAHVGQYAEYGDLGFLLRYGSDYLKNRLQGMDEHEAYENIPFEKEARAKDQQIRDDLKQKYGDSDPCPEPEVCHADYE